MPLIGRRRSHAPQRHDSFDSQSHAFLNIRVADIGAVYEQWRARGANFLTPPMDRGNEIRCYMRDPDGHLIEVGQLVGEVKD